MAGIECVSAMNATITKQKQTFSIKAPTAKSVLLAGDFTGWLKQAIPLHKNAHDVWKTTTSLAPGTYHYRFVVDGQWCDDPKCKVRVKNPFGTQNDVIQIFGRPATESQSTQRKSTGAEP